MLQQTRVGTVIPYYEAFLRRFPDVETLAAAAVDEVLAAWSGLGYYRRARQLHRAAVEIVAGGRGFPATAEELQRLPGIGPYTAAAVASIAYGEVVPVLDGNVERLLCRWLAYGEDPKRAAPRRKLVAVAAAMLDPSRPGDSNQALMELGATVCRPSKPGCSDCPLAESCEGRRRGDPESYPSRRPSREIEHLQIAVAVVRRRRQVLLFKRSEGSDVLPGMWELPNVPRSASRGEIEAALGKRYGGRWKLSEAASNVRHAITYRSIAVSAHEALFEAGDSVAEGPEAAWVDAAGRARLPTSSLVEKVLAGFRPRGRRAIRRHRH